MAGNPVDEHQVSPQVISLDALRPRPASRNAGSVVIRTHGCKLNQADSINLARRFSLAGYRVVEDAGEADIYVLNTCTVTAAADAKARQALRAARRANPDAIVVAAGCYPQRAAGDLASMPEVSLVVGNDDKESLVDLAVAAHRELLGLEESAAAGLNDASLDYEGFPGESTGGSLPGRTRAMVKIQEGCDQVCAYCIVPRVRGRERSIPPGLIIRQVRQFVAEGRQEVVLTGTQLGSYGFDLPDTNLKHLIRGILAETDITRLRVSSLQAQEIDEDLLRLWMDDARLCPHFHIPLQSGSDSILTAMRRRYTTGRFVATVQMVRDLMPDAGITTDLIVGFPGEGDREFEEGLSFAGSMEFSDLHVFPYSRRPGTSAVYLEGQVPEPIKRERMNRALEMARTSFDRFRLGLLGSQRHVLWEGERRAGTATGQRGLTDNYVRVAMAGRSAGGNVLDLSNRITLAQLTELRGDVVMAMPILTSDAAGTELTEEAGKQPNSGKGK